MRQLFKKKKQKEVTDVETGVKGQQFDELNKTGSKASCNHTTSREDDVCYAANQVERDEPTSPTSWSSPMQCLKKTFSGEKTVHNSRVVYENFANEFDRECYIRTDDSVPSPKTDNDVIVKVKASSMTLKDCNIMRGIWYESIPVPNTPGFDIVGTIYALGEKVAKDGYFQVGDPVAACVRSGGNTKFCNVQSKDLIRVPGVVDSAHAVSLVSTYMTAYQALHRVKPKNEKDTLEGTSVLITGGNGPIGSAAIDLALRAGCGRVYTTAAMKYHKMLHDKGAIVLPLDQEKWLPVVKGKMDLVIDGLCQDEYYSPHQALNSKGHLVVVGMTLQTNKQQKGVLGMPATALWSTTKANYLMSRTSTYCPWKSSILKPMEYKHDLEYLFGLLQRGKIKPKIGRRVTLEQVPKAYKDLENGDLDGLIVCKPWK